MICSAPHLSHFQVSYDDRRELLISVMPPLGWRKAVDGGVKGTKGKHSAEHSDSPSNPPLVPERGGAAIEALGGKLGVLDTQRERGRLDV